MSLPGEKVTIDTMAEAEDEAKQETEINQGMKMYTSPICVIVIGMAGSGKTTLMQRLATYSLSESVPSYLLNLDPAVKTLGYDPNIDIRSTVDYKQVMKQYGLGPNGGIMTALNLFATRFDQVVNILERRNKEIDFAFVDTPGQIEAFTWSASGQIITSSLAVTFPTVLLYVVDTPRSTNPVTFMSNMLYACSILYKTRLPFVLVFNKVDVVSHDFLAEWMTDYEAFQTALDNSEDQSYMTSFTRSMSLVLEEFYNNLRAVGVSAASGVGMKELFKALEDSAKEYEQNYKPDIEAKRKQIDEEKQRQREKSMESMMQSMNLENAEARGKTESGVSSESSSKSAEQSQIEKLSSGKQQQIKTDNDDQNLSQSGPSMPLSEEEKEEEKAYNELLKWVEKQKVAESKKKKKK